MVSLLVNPLTFDNKKNEILYSPNKIEWKKQIATVSLKKGFSVEAYLNEKILSKLETKSKPYMFAKFKYIPENGKNNEIYLACLPGENSKIITDLYYESHIPSNNQILILEGQKKNITKNSQYLRVKGDVLALCIDVATYYLDEINLGEYIEFVQMENDEANQDEDCSDIDDDELDEDEDEDDMDDDIEDAEEEDADEDDALEDAEEEDADEDVDAIEDADEDVDAIEDADEDVDAIEDVEEEDANAIEDAEEEDADAIEDAEEEDVEEDAEEEAEEAVDDEENTGGGVDEIDDEQPEPKASYPSSKRKKTGSSKSIKFNAGLDTSILFNILKKEDEKKLIPEAQLHLKRKICIKILKLLELPVKTIQFIEKGIYNYVIEKCSANSIIPIWENQEFSDMYISKSKSIYSNLNTKCYVGNKELLEKVKKGKINPYELAFLESHKLYPEKWNDIIEEKAKMDKMLKESLKESATDLFQCVRCKKRKTIYCEVQTRSSDEPMTKFITCLECGYKWKQY
jgi:DNA-directed RNA polymerase subunit M/transcription elongation factor TFIIS